MRRAYEILETLAHIPIHREAKGAGELALMLARRLQNGVTEKTIRERIDLPGPDRMKSAVAVLRARIRALPYRPRQAPPEVRYGQAERTVDEVRGHAPGGLYARLGERPGVIDVGQVPGGWRELIERKREEGERGH
jgi:hypothetical protein